MKIDKKKLRARIDDLAPPELRTLIKMIGGKLSRRTISAEDQARLQQARKEKRDA